MAECGSCHAQIVWAITPAGARAPIDRQPNREKGNVLLLQPAALQADGEHVLLAVVLSKDALKLAQERNVHGVSLYTNHWATCPDRQEWRERTDAKRQEEAQDEQKPV